MKNCSRDKSEREASFWTELISTGCGAGKSIEGKKPISKHCLGLVLVGHNFFSQVSDGDRIWPIICITVGIISETDGKQALALSTPRKTASRYDLLLTEVA